MTSVPVTANLGATPNIGAYGMMSMGFQALSGVMAGVNSIIAGKQAEKAAKRAQAQANANAAILETLGGIAYERERKDVIRVLKAQGPAASWLP